MRRRNPGADENPQGKYDTTEAGAEDNLDGTPRPSGEDIQVTGKGDARKNVGEENIDGACQDKLVERRPI